jgi:hypothetical protein
MWEWLLLRVRSVATRVCAMLSCVENGKRGKRVEATHSSTHFSALSGWWGEGGVLGG